MASAAPAQQLPLLYKNLEPLSSNIHGNYKIRAIENAPYLSQIHAVPVTIDEFVAVQRYYPIIFSTGETSVPLALMGLNEGVNTFLDDEGKLLGETYVPAYVRRYPFLLARTQPGVDDLSLCFDPESDVIGDFEDGTPLFDNGQPSEATQAILKFCEDFELSAQRTGAFITELQTAELLIDGEASVQPQGSEPFVYRGFRMISEEKLRDLRGDTLRKMNQNGMLPLMMAHLFSLSLVPELFARQVRQGKGPQLQPAAQPATA
jgi:hypothetical protein